MRDTRAGSIAGGMRPSSAESRAVTTETPAPGAPDDDSLADNVGEVIDVILADGIGPTEPEDPWERRQRLLDSWTAIILAVAAVATAWASFQASQWGGSQTDAQSRSAIERSDANRASSEAVSDQVVDSQMWIAWVEAVAAGQPQRAAFYRERFSPTLQAATKAWQGDATIGPDGAPTRIPAGTPMDLQGYVVPARVQADELSARAEASLAEADQAGEVSTKYVLIAVLFALVLFFASIATKFTGPKVQVMLILISLVLLALSTIRMLLLPVSI